VFSVLTTEIRIHPRKNIFYSDALPQCVWAVLTHKVKLFSSTAEVLPMTNSSLDNIGIKR